MFIAIFNSVVAIFYLVTSQRYARAFDGCFSTTPRMPSISSFEIGPFGRYLEA